MYLWKFSSVFFCLPRRTLTIIHLDEEVLPHNSWKPLSYTHLNLSIMARIMRSRRLAFAAAGHCKPTASKSSGGGKSGSRLRPSRTLLPSSDEERIESGSLSVSDGDAARSLSPSPPLLRNSLSLGELTGVFCCCAVAATRQTIKNFVVPTRTTM